MRSGDTLVAWRLDRLSRSLRHLVDVIAALEQRHVAFHALREAIDTTTTTANGRLQLHLFAALAEFERELIRGRRQAGREVAKAAGRLGGRPLIDHVHDVIDGGLLGSDRALPSPAARGSARRIHVNDSNPQC